MKERLVKNNKTLKIIGIAIIILALPLVLILVKQNQDNRGSAAAADKLETEGGTLSSSGVSKQTDTTASGGQYVLFANVVSSPTPTLSPNSPTPTPIGTVYNIPTSIDKTGATNVTTAMRNFIASVPNGNTIVFPTNASYNMASGGIRLSGRSNLRFVGNSTTIKTAGCTYNDAPFLIENSSSGISVDGFTLVGGNTLAGTSQAYDTCGDNAHGVAIFVSYNITLTNLKFRNIYADCVYVSESHTLGRSKGLTFTDSVCELQGRMGVAIVGGENITVQRVHFDKISLHPFDIEPNGATGGAINVVITDNTIGTFGVDPLLSKRLFPFNGYDNGSAPVNNITFSRNTVTGGPLIIVSDDPGRSNIKITDNTSTVRVAGPVMDFRNCSGLTITGNTQPLSSGQLASFSSCTAVTYNSNNTN